MLGPAQRDIGQLAVAFADAVNSQNRLGMDLDFQLGGDIFTLPELTGDNDGAASQPSAMRAVRSMALSTSDPTHIST
mgnify:CR=1 FL=1